MDNKKNFEIDIIGILKQIMSEKKLLGIFVAIFMVAGIIVALNKQKEYTANVVLAPEISGMGMSQSLGDIASMVGVNLGGSSNSTDAIYPDIYPDVFASNDFIINLFDVKVTTQKTNVTKTYYNHLLEDIETPFWKYPSKWVHNILSKLSTPENDNNKTSRINPFCLTKTQNSVCGAIKNNISCMIDKKTSVITIAVADVDPQIAAIMADTIQNRLQEYILMYRTKKARNDMEYAMKIYKESKEQYVKAQQIYSAYTDANNDVILQSFKSKQEELENEMQLRYNIYNQSVAQLQSAKAKVQECTPAFTIIQSSTVPLKASSTPRSTIIIIFMVLGIICDIIWVVWLRSLIAKFRR